jgi:two-component system LytT family response regulator
MKNVQTIKTLIVDDEKLARERLNQILNKYQDIEILESCRDGNEAIDAINRLQPDLVFLDIEMPEKDGFDVMSDLDNDRQPLIVFITAHSQYAVKAFEVDAYDYVHKPLNEERIENIIQKSRERLSGVFEEDVVGGNKSESPLKPDIYALKSGKTLKIVKQEEVEWFEASGNYVKLVHQGKKYMVRSTLSGFLEKLDQEKFFQIHKSTIINLDYVDRFEELLYGDYTVHMKNGQELRMSRGYNDFLKKMAKSHFQ